MSYAGQVETGGGALSPIGSTLYGLCSTGAATAGKVVDLADYDELITGTTVHVKFTYGNTASSPTLQVGSTTAKPIYAYGTTAPGNTAAASWAANSMVSFTYDGTAWRMNDSGANAAIITLLEGELATKTDTLRGTIAPNYSSSSTYRKNQLVMRNELLYRAKQDITTPEAWTASHWEQTTVAAEREYKLVFENVSVAVSDFAADATYSAFPWKASVSLTGVKSTMVPELAFGLMDAISGNFAPEVASYNGGVYIYAASKPSAAVTIPTIVCWG